MNSKDVTSLSCNFSPSVKVIQINTNISNTKILICHFFVCPKLLTYPDIDFAVLLVAKKLKVNPGVT